MRRSVLSKFMMVLTGIIIFAQMPLLVSAADDAWTQNDFSFDNSYLTGVTVYVLTNDLPNAAHWKETTVRLINPFTFEPVPTYTETGYGVWTANNDGSITFLPCSGAGTPDTSCTGPLKGDPLAIDYIVKDQANVDSNPSSIQVTYSDPPLNVSVAYFRSVAQEETVQFTWATVTESNTAGFNVLVETTDGQAIINDELIESHVIDSIVPQLYTYETAVIGDVFFLQEVSLNGGARTYGPYELGMAYGEMPDGLVPETNDFRIYLPFIVGE